MAGARLFLSAVQALFEAVREACSAAVWSRGVGLVRARAVSAEATQTAAELCLRVVAPGAALARRVTLAPEDEDWECDCRGRDDPCEHVAAAVIAVRRARERGDTLPTAVGSTGGPGSLRYCFESRAGQSLHFRREVVCGENVSPLTTSLGAIAAEGTAGLRVAATQADLAVDRALGGQPDGPILRERAPRLFEALASCADVTLDGKPVVVSAERLRPLARVEDAGDGFRVQIAPDPAITRSFGNGIALCGDTLHAVGASGLSGREIEELGTGRLYAADEAARLVGEVLPSLERSVRLDVRTRRLPRAGPPEPPRIRIDARLEGSRLSVLPTLVYGDPPRARIDAGRLVHLNGPVPRRDADAEARLKNRLRAELGLAPGRRAELVGESALDLADALRRFGAEVGGGVLSRLVRAAPLEPRVRLEGDRLFLDFASPAPEGGAGQAPRPVSGVAALRAWRDGEDWIPLPGGGFAPLPRDWLARHGQLVAELLAARDSRGAVPAHATPALVELCDDLDLPRPPALERLTPLFDASGQIPPASLPADLRAELREYQHRGVDWLCFHRDAELGALLADDMGLGKTLQALCALRGRTLVVAPTSVLHNWGEEIQRFRPGLHYSMYHGPRRQLNPEAAITLTSYALLRLDGDTLCAPDWDCVVLDEAQNIKNPDSQVARAARALRARFRLALTGTPVENRLDELWSQFHFLQPGLLGDRRSFREHTARPIGEGDRDAALRLRRRIRPFVLRRRKREVAPELPPRTEVVLHCELSDAERAVYDAIRAAARRDVVQQLAAGGSVLPALEALLRLRQAACHSDLIPGQHAETSSKLEMLLERLGQALEDGHRALVFSQWTSFLDRLEPHLRARAIRFGRLDGSTRDRGAVVRAFQDASGAPVLLASLKAGGTGINLTAADHVFLLDPWWNPAVEDQAADRAHRIGQVRPVVIHRLVAADSVEERILEMQRAKRSLFDAAMGDADQAASLTREELLDLLS